MSLVRFNYDVTIEELASLGEEIRYRTAKSAKIDAERLRVQVTKVIAYQVREEAPYFRADSAEVSLDGRDFNTTREEARIRWLVQQTMIGLHRKPDAARLHPWVESGVP